jgi:hypothetical protein
MKSFRTFIMAVSFSFLLIGMFASTAGAQVAAKGKFTLPFEVQWGKWTMPAGNYTFMLDRTVAGGIVKIQSEDLTATFLIQHTTAFGHELFGDSELHLRRVNGAWQIEEFHLPPAGRALTYRRGTGADATQVVRNREPMKILRVTVSGK